MRAVERSYVRWPKIVVHIENVVNSCDYFIHLKTQPWLAMTEISTICK